MSSVNLDKYHIHVIDFLSIVSDCEHDILRDLDEYDLKHPLNLKNNSTKTIFYYFILKRVCDIVMNNKTGNKCVFFYNPSCISRYNLSFVEIKQEDAFVIFLNTFIKKLNNILPMLFFKYDDVCFEDIMNESCDGDYTDMMSCITAAHQKKANKKFTFERSKIFVKKHNLTYLDREYFNKVKVKMLMYK